MNIPAIRAQLKKAAARELALKQTVDLLSTQLGNFERGMAMIKRRYGR